MSTKKHPEPIGPPSLVGLWSQPPVSTDPDILHVQGRPLPPEAVRRRRELTARVAEVSAGAEERRKALGADSWVLRRRTGVGQSSRWACLAFLRTRPAGEAPAPTGITVLAEFDLPAHAGRVAQIVARQITEFAAQTGQQVDPRELADLQRQMEDPAGWDPRPTDRITLGGPVTLAVGGTALIVAAGAWLARLRRAGG